MGVPTEPEADVVADAGPGPVPLAYGRAPPPRFGNGFLAAMASLWLPGLGHWLAHERRRAVKWLLVYVVLTLISIAVLAVPPLAPAMIVLVPLGVVVTIACAVDAWRETALPRLPNPALRVLAGVPFLIAAAIVPAALPLALLVRAHVAETFEVNSAPMGPTLQPGDRFVAHKLGQRYRRWDVVAFRYPENPELTWVMRVVGLPGERIEIVDGVVTIDGEALTPPPSLGPYTSPRAFRQPPNAGEYNPIQLADNEYFVLGDNSPMAYDSRMWEVAAPGHQPGAVPADMIVGRATWTYWPPSRWENLEPPR